MRYKLYLQNKVYCYITDETRMKRSARCSSIKDVFNEPICFTHENNPTKVDYLDLPNIELIAETEVLEDLKFKVVWMFL